MNRLTRGEKVASWFIGLGILLLLIGWRGYRYVPMTEEEAEQEAALQAILSFHRQALAELPDELRPMFKQNIERLEQSSVRNSKEKPYRTLGTIGLIVGGVVLTMGGILWSRSRPAGGRWIGTNEDA